MIWIASYWSASCHYSRGRAIVKGIILHVPVWIRPSTISLSSILMWSKWSEECVHKVLPATLLPLSICSSGSPFVLPNAVFLLPCLVEFPSKQIERNLSCVVIPSMFLPPWVLVQVTLSVGDAVLGQGCCIGLPVHTLCTALSNYLALQTWENICCTLF